MGLGELVPREVHHVAAIGTQRLHHARAVVGPLGLEGGEDGGARVVTVAV